MITKFLLFVFAVGFVAGYNPFMDYLPGFVETGYGEFVGRKECTQMGLMCENCTTSVFCNQGANGEWNKYPAANCGNGTTCRDGQCTTSHLPECEEELDDLEFVCTEPGMFPHPYNCKKYFMCTVNATDPSEVIPEPTEFNCTTGWGYDPLRATCRIQLTNEVCATRAVPQCTTIGAQGPVGGNPALFYVCLPVGNVTTPHLFHCAKNYEFFDGTCRDPNPIGVENGRCTKLGNFLDPTNCRNYKECTVVGNAPSNRTCSLNYKFMPKTSKCEIFPCNCY